MIAFDIKVAGGDDLAKKLANKSTRLGQQLAVTADPLEAFVAQIGLAAAKFSKQAAPEDLGTIRRGIEFTFRGGEGLVESKAKHTVHVIKGRGKNKKMPPLKIIRDWVVRRGMPASAAFPVARAIGRRGIPPNDFLQAGFDKALKLVSPTRQKFVKGVEQEWRKP